MPIRELTPQGGAEEGRQRVERIVVHPGSPKEPTPQGGAEDHSYEVDRIVGGA
jgi:hypothetical protein